MSYVFSNIILKKNINEADEWWTYTNQCNMPNLLFHGFIYWSQLEVFILRLKKQKQRRYLVICSSALREFKILWKDFFYATIFSCSARISYLIMGISMRVKVQISLQGGDVNDSINCILKNLTEMNNLWIRM